MYIPIVQRENVTKTGYVPVADRKPASTFTPPDFSFSSPTQTSVAQSTPPTSSDPTIQSFLKSQFTPRTEAVDYRRAFEITPIKTKAPPIVTELSSLGTGLLEAIPRTIATISGEIAGQGKATTVSSPVDLRRFGYDTPDYVTAAKEQEDSIKNGENPWLSGLRIMGNKTLDIAFGASMITGLLRASTAKLVAGGVEAKIEAQNVVDAYRATSKEAFEALRNSPLAEREKVAADLANMHTRAVNTLKELGAPTKAERARFDLSKVTEVVGRETPMGKGYLDRMMRPDLGMKPRTLPPVPVSGLLQGDVPLYEGAPAGLSAQPVKRVGATPTRFTDFSEVDQRIMTRFSDRVLSGKPSQNVVEDARYITNLLNKRGLNAPNDVRKLANQISVMKEALVNEKDAQEMVAMNEKLGAAVSADQAAKDMVKAKFNKPVGLEQFRMAVVPDTISPEALKILEDKGLQIIKYAKGEKAKVMQDLLKSDVAFKTRNVAKSAESQGVPFNMPVAEAEKISRSMFDKNEIDFLFPENITHNGRDAWGLMSPRKAFQNPLIQAVQHNGMVSDLVLYHESFHAYFYKFVSEADRRALLDSVMGEKLTAPARGLYALEGYKGADVRAEEYIADAFAQFMKDRSAPATLKSFFQRLMDKIRGWIQKTTKMQDMFNRIVSKDRSFTKSRSKTITSKDMDMMKLSKSEIQKEKNIPAILYDDLSTIAESIRKTDLTAQELEEIKINIEIAEDAIDQLPGKKLMKYVSKKTGELPEVTGQTTMQSISGSGTTVKRGKFGQMGDEIVTELGFKDVEDAQKGLETYKAARERLDILKDRAREIRVEKSAVRKGERLMQLAKSDRRSAYRNMVDYFGLTEAELSKMRQGKDIMAMDSQEFDSFIRRAEDKAEEIVKTREARIQVESTIRELDLRKVENLQEAMKLPTIANMSEGQLKKFDEILSSYKTADEFLPVRQLETIDSTALNGMKTTREVQNHLAKTYNLTPEQMPGIKPHPWMYDTQLARQHPLFDLLVSKYNESYLKAAGRSIEVERKADNLITKARKSIGQSLGEKMVPTDAKIVEWLESDNRAAVAETMTKEQLDAAEYMDGIYQEYYDWLSKRELEKKFSSRFEDKYFPHIRRGFLEAFKEDGFLKAFKEARAQFLNDEKMLTILDEKTKLILPYQKWVKFSQFRSGDLVPTKNAALAFKAYVNALEKARQFDEFIPEIMVYVHSLTPEGLTDRGLEMNDSLQRFVKSWINSKKGRVEKQILKPGGKMDWALRTGIAITRIRDLGLSAVGLTSFFGEQAGNITMLGIKDYSIGSARLLTKQGKEISNKYAEFVGKPFFETLSEASNNIGDTLMGGIFGLFSVASRKANQIFLLGSMTKEEFTNGTISVERLAKLRNAMGEYRVVSGSESIFGKSVEGAVAGQYKKWAIPILVSTKDNAVRFISLLAKKGIKEALTSKEGSQLFYSIVLGTALGIGMMGYYNELSSKKRNFVEDIISKSLRDALSLIGALDPKFIGSFAAPRLSAFIVDLTTAIDDLLFLQTYKTTGNLKGLGELKNLAMPSFVRTLASMVPSDTAPAKSTKKVKTPSGLPKLPSAKVKIPTPMGLPKLPKL